MTKWQSFKRACWEVLHARKGWWQAAERERWNVVDRAQINRLQRELKIAIDAGKMMERERDTAVHNQKLLIADRDQLRTRLQRAEDALRRPRTPWRPGIDTFEPANGGTRLSALMGASQPKALVWYRNGDPRV